MRILIVGIGSIGRRHLRNLQRLGVTDFLAWRVRNLPLPDSLAPAVETYEDLDSALSKQPDAALICNPPSQHLPVAIRAAEAGCHLFLEKPLSSSMDRVPELLSVVQRKGLAGLVGFNLRFHPGLRLLKRLLEEGRIGRPLSIRAEVGQYLPDWHPDEDYRLGYSASRRLGGGVILDLIHELDYVRWLLGEVQSVTCLCGHLSSLEIETEDVAEIALQFENGAIGSVHMDYIQRPPARACRIFGENGTLSWNYHSNEVRLWEGDGPDWRVFSQDGFKRNDMFVDEMRHFLACIDGRESPVVDLEQGARVQELACAASRSAQTGKLQRI